jgi:hypothetical protein
MQKRKKEEKNEYSNKTGHLDGSHKVISLAYCKIYMHLNDA